MIVVSAREVTRLLLTILQHEQTRGRFAINLAGFRLLVITIFIPTICLPTPNIDKPGPSSILQR